jgi:hypothetical protein
MTKTSSSRCATIVQQFASRMESNGVSGRIQGCDAIYQRLREVFRFQPRGLIEVKGEGQLPSYLFTGRVSSKVA